MTSNSPDPAETARNLLNQEGLDGIVQAGVRAEACRLDGDTDGVRFWNAVARTMRLLTIAGAGGADNGEASRLSDRVSWRLMQRVELFRYRAAECRRQATEASDAGRPQLLELERRWLELATYAELLAECN